jgi:MEMO1 family protein
MVRRPVVSGRFYPSNKEQLRSEIEACFKSRLGPGSVPAVEGAERSVVGGVVPHAGFVYSGHEAAWFYRSLMESGLPECVVIIGPNHSGMGNKVSVFSKGSWETPFGEVGIDEALASEIVASGTASSDELAHKFEHSIEVQLPFLQFIYSIAGKNFTFVPVTMLDQSRKTALFLGHDIASAIKNIKRSAVVIASTDFSHYVAPGEAKKLDSQALARIAELDLDGLFDVVEECGISMCGCGPTGATIAAARDLGAGAGKLLKYGTSGDVHKMDEVVGYGAVVFSKERM